MGRAAASVAAAVCRRWLRLVLLGVLLQAVSVRRAGAEDQIDFKTLYYQESGDRMKSLAQTFLYQRETGSGVTFRIEGIYNTISGASPTGLPALREVTVTRSLSSGGGGLSTLQRSAGADDARAGEGAIDSRGFRRRSTREIVTQPAAAYRTRAGATPTSSPSPAPTGGGDDGSSSSSSSSSAVTTETTQELDPSGEVPTAEVSDKRLGLTLEIGKKFERHAPAIVFSWSTEKDYLSRGLGLKEAIEFNRKNTTLLLGAACANDTVSDESLGGDRTKNTYDVMVGIAQVLDSRTLVTVNLTQGFADGYLTDPYKEVWLNGAAAAEKRPDEKSKQIAYLALTRFVETLNGSAEVGYRRYHDSFGIGANTVSLSWYQKVGDSFVVRPDVRWYEQSAADFYSVQFTGDPDYYSSDYRLSALRSWVYGAKVVWTPNQRFSADLSVERYEQSGKDGVTPADTYPKAMVYQVGFRAWF